MLYGLGDAGVPTGALIDGARPRTVAQKAPAGAQHPTGDAATVAAGFLAAGGDQVLVYMQDVYARWPYEQLGLDDYRRRARTMLERVADRPDRDRFVWVPFNEPDWIWYPDWATDRDRFLADWATLVGDIRTAIPGAQVAGPNEMEFNPRRMRDFLDWTAEHAVLPDVIAWHELSPSALSTYPEHYAEYRQMEAELGIAPLPVNIDEYGRRCDFSVPGRLLPWIAMFEQTKVDADLAYWTYAGNLDDHAVRGTEANGGWWLLKWYADLTGSTVLVEAVGAAPHAVASLDEDRRQLTVLVGGAEVDRSVVIRGLDPSRFGARVDVTRTTVGWTGYEGAAREPRYGERRRTPLADRLELTVPGGDPLAAHRIVVTPAEEHPDTRPEPLWRSWEAEDASIRSGTVRRVVDDPQAYAVSGDGDVTGLDADESAVGFAVEAPGGGAYRLGIVYGTDGAVGRHALFLDDAFVREVVYPATLSSTYRGRLELDLDLPAGRHRLELRTSGPHGRLDGPGVSLDRIELAPAPPPQRVHAARSARLVGSARLVPGAPAAPAVARLDPGGAARFHLASAESGVVALTVLAQGPEVSCAVLVGDRPVPVRTGVPALLHLGQGVTVVSVRAEAVPVDLVGLRVEPAEAAAEHPWLPVAALPVAVAVPPAADTRSYDLVLRYGNAARESGHDYNTDVVSATLRVRVGDAETGPDLIVRLGPTHAWDSFAERTVPLEVPAGARVLVRAADEAAGEITPAVAAVRLIPLSP